MQLKINNYATAADCSLITSVEKRWFQVRITFILALVFVMKICESYDCDPRAVRLDSGRCACQSAELCDNSPNMRSEPGSVCINCLPGAAPVTCEYISEKGSLNYDVAYRVQVPFYHGDCPGGDILNYTPHFDNVKKCGRLCQRMASCKLWLWILDDTPCGPGRCIPKYSICENPWANASTPRNHRLFVPNVFDIIDGFQRPFAVRNHKLLAMWSDESRVNCNLTITGSGLPSNVIARRPSDCAERCLSNPHCLNFAWPGPDSAEKRKCIFNAQVSCEVDYSKQTPSANSKQNSGSIDVVLYQRYYALNGYDSPLLGATCSGGNLDNATTDTDVRLRVQLASVCAKQCDADEKCKAFLWIKLNPSEESDESERRDTLNIGHPMDGFYDYGYCLLKTGECLKGLKTIEDRRQMLYAKSSGRRVGPHVRKSKYGIKEIY